MDESTKSKSVELLKTTDSVIEPIPPITDDIAVQLDSTTPSSAKKSKKKKKKKLSAKEKQLVRYER